jgi:VanZ family protein
MEIKKIIYASLSVIWTTAILYFSIMPAPELPAVGPNLSGFIQHLTAYLIYGLLLQRTFSRFSVPRRNAIVASVLAGLILGIFTEAIQLFIPNRVADIVDFVADIIGVLIGSVLAAYTKNIRLISK